MKSKKPADVNKATKQRLKDYVCRTITNDNGFEFGMAEILETQLSAKIYFAHPYSSWERGTNEQVNGVIREYLPKGTDFTDVGPSEIKAIEDAINLRPRKTLGYRTPYEVFFNKQEKLISEIWVNPDSLSEVSSVALYA